MVVERIDTKDIDRDKFLHARQGQNRSTFQAVNPASTRTTLPLLVLHPTSPYPPIFHSAARRLKGLEPFFCISSLTKKIVSVHESI